MFELVQQRARLEGVGGQLGVDRVVDLVGVVGRGALVDAEDVDQLHLHPVLHRRAAEQLVVRGEDAPRLAGLFVAELAADRDAEVGQVDALAVQDAVHVVVGREQQVGRVPERDVVGDPHRGHVPVGRDDGEVLDLLVQLAGDRARLRLCREQAIGVKSQRLRHGVIVAVTSGRVRRMPPVAASWHQVAQPISHWLASAALNGLPSGKMGAIQARAQADDQTPAPRAWRSITEEKDHHRMSEKTGSAQIGVVGTGRHGLEPRAQLRQPRLQRPPSSTAPPSKTQDVVRPTPRPGSSPRRRCPSSSTRWRSRAASSSWSRPAPAPTPPSTQLGPRLLEPGDIIVDGGNAFFHGHPIRRETALREHDLHFVGAGISGGEEGALEGPLDHARRLAAVLRVRRPDAGGHLRQGRRPRRRGALLHHIGTDGAGHFVKMVHNGIEYADMQFIGEAYDLLEGRDSRPPRSPTSSRSGTPATWIPTSSRSPPRCCARSTPRPASRSSTSSSTPPAEGHRHVDGPGGPRPGRPREQASPRPCSPAPRPPAPNCAPPREGAHGPRRQGRGEDRAAFVEDVRRRSTRQGRRLRPGLRRDQGGREGLRLGHRRGRGRAIWRGRLHHPRASSRPHLERSTPPTSSSPCSTAPSSPRAWPTPTRRGVASS